MAEPGAMPCGPLPFKCHISYIDVRGQILCIKLQLGYKAVFTQPCQAFALSIRARKSIANSVPWRSRQSVQSGDDSRAGQALASCNLIAR